MIGKPFINETFSKAIDLYLKYKDNPNNPQFQTFLAVVVRSLVLLYSELDILNPYITQNEKNMGGLDGNLSKYGFPDDAVEDFKNQFNVFDDNIKKGIKPNAGFLMIEKYLINMYFYKKKSVKMTPNDETAFKSLLYLPENTNTYIQEDLKKYLTKLDDVECYFKSVEYENSHNFTLDPIHRSTLLPESYLLLGYSLEQISTLTDQDLQSVNNQVYKFFGVDAKSDERESLLEKAVNYYKRYGNRVTSGNGYVDFLLFASILATVIFISILFALHYF